VAPCQRRRDPGARGPSDGSDLARIARGGAADIDAAVAAARAALEGAWGRTSALERGRILSAIGRKVLDNVELLAALEVHDVGKPLKQARADAVALARYFEFYGGCCDKVHGETLPFAAGYTALTLREPQASPATSCPGTTRCRSSAAASAPPWRWATPAS
jgi:aldehyde dehydrogenase (NAD+)